MAQIPCIMCMQVICAFCSSPFDRATGEVNRSIRLGRPQYCSTSCSTKGARARGTSQGNQAKWTPETRPLNGGRKRDELTPFRGYFNKLKSRKSCSLILQDLKDVWDEQGGVCPLTGWSLDLPMTNNDPRFCHPRRASLDRINSSLGYHRDNIRWVSAIANFAKNHWTDEDVIEFAQAVVENR
jgi:hypothetical protein